MVINSEYHSQWILHAGYVIFIYVSLSLLPQLSMAKGLDSRKAGKKEPKLSPKEKKAAKREKAARNG